jgi:hypothetical protein
LHDDASASLLVDLMEHRRPRHGQFLPMILDQPPPLLGVASGLLTFGGLINEYEQAG